LTSELKGGGDRQRHTSGAFPKNRQKKRQFPVIGNRRDKNTYYSADLDGMIMLIGNHTFPTEEQGFF
jgi:hypothetical protein